MQLHCSIRNTNHFCIPMIKLTNINKSYRMGDNNLHVLKGINLHIREGEMVSIMGSSGSGKSTLLNILGILDNYDSGEYKLASTLVKDLSETQAARYRNQFIGFVFQSFNLVSFKNAMENVALPLYYKGVSRKKRNALALEYLDKMGLRNWANHMPNEMSGGQKQRFSIATTLINEPLIIFLDEPTTGLDPQARRNLWQLIRDIRDKGTTVIITTHYMDEAEVLCDRVAIMDAGRIISLDTPDRMIDRLVESGFERPKDLKKANLEDVFISLTGQKDISYD